MSIKLDTSRPAIVVLDDRGKPLRIIDIRLLKENMCLSFDIRLSVDKGLDFIVVRIRMEYDLVSTSSVPSSKRELESVMLGSLSVVHL